MSKFRGHHLPLLATTALLVILFASFSLAFRNFFSLRVITDLFINNAHVGIVAVGMTCVILSGGIDLSVGSLLAFTTIFIGTLVTKHSVHPLLAIALALTMGTLLGAGQGALVQSFQLPPFLVTLAGMFLFRGLAFVISPQSLEIKHPFYQAVVDFGLPLSDRVQLRATACVFLAVFLLALWLLYFTPFGRNIYALGGSESSAVLMGLPVGRTKILVYALSGFCAGLAGVVFTFHTQSGNPMNGAGLELDAIAAVVIGGTLLSGGVGSVAGTLLGVLIYGTILTALNFHGGFDSSWQRILIGALLLVFIGLQRFLTRTAGRPAPQ